MRPSGAGAAPPQIPISRTDTPQLSSLLNNTHNGFFPCFAYYSFFLIKTSSRYVCAAERYTSGNLSAPRGICVSGSQKSLIFCGKNLLHAPSYTTTIDKLTHMLYNLGYITTSNFSAEEVNANVRRVAVSLYGNKGSLFSLGLSAEHHQPVVPKREDPRRTANCSLQPMVHPERRGLSPEERHKMRFAPLESQRGFYYFFPSFSSSLPLR